MEITHSLPTNSSLKSTLNMAGRHHFTSSVQKPKYAQIQDFILASIQDGTWSSGDRIPAERALADHFNASVGTIRHALAGLVEQGFLSREQGRGTFVNSSTEHADSLRYYRFAKDFSQEVSALTIRSLAKPSLVKYSLAAEKIGLNPGSSLFKYSRLFLMDSSPVAYVTSYLVADLLPGFERITKKMLDEIPLYLLVEGKYNMPTLATKEGFSAVAAESEVAKVMNVDEGTAVLRMEMLAMTTRKIIYEYRESYCVTSGFQIIR